MSLTRNLTPELSASLKERVASTLSRIVKSNTCTTYFNESPLLSDLRNEITSLDSAARVSNESESGSTNILTSFTNTVPLSTFPDYIPFTSRLFEVPCLVSRVTNLFAPGLPSFVAHSSGTSGDPAKAFPKYTHDNALPLPKPAEIDDMTICMVVSLQYTRVIEVVEDTKVGKATQKIALPMCPFGNGTLRIHQGISLHDDEALMTQRLPSFNTSPHAVSQIKSYRAFLLMHGLFAVADASLNLLAVPFGTILYDLVRLLEEHWGALVEAIEEGVLPEVDGLKDVKSYLQAVLVPNPRRAAELRSIDAGAEGWLKKVWPKLMLIRTIVSGPYGRVLPQLRYHLGALVNIRSAIYGATEACLAYGYTPQNLDIFKMWEEEHFEYLDVDRPEEARELCQAWELERGKRYELVVTTRDGLWRYRLGDIVEAFGFDPADGQPVIKFSERRHMGLQVANARLSERELSEGMDVIRDTLGEVIEFTTVLDNRWSPPSIGFFVELNDEYYSRLKSEAASSSAAPHFLDTFFSNANESYRICAESGLLGVPTIRVVAPGTFFEYRGWQVDLSGNGSVQIKVPSVVTNEKVVKWLENKVAREI